ncbi:MAG: sigma 54-interacting transcriptional regulator [Spirochaetaceae bacterium]|nr:sigma 54-interacting transcriptional regulator [Spirochaetaceae bacterium]MDT8296881.1 sigma 54-interacting transcriptional regulator [Spirochaetaceae bacterium]
MHRLNLPDNIVRKLEEQDFEIYSLREMMNRLQEGIYITDNRGVTLYVNSAYIHLSGLNREDLIGRRVHDLRDDGVLPNSCCARVIETQAPVSTINNFYQGQKCLVSGSPIFDQAGNLIRTVAIVRDVSELDAIMDRLAREEQSFIIESDASDRSGLPRSGDPVMQELFDKAARLAELDSSLLIIGETGTGKDHLAKAIHNMGAARKKGQLVRINCGAIPEHLIESELFGYEPGAFTGASPGGKKGLFELAGNGTVLLDEIGDMPYLLQVKLLNVLNDRQFYRVGGGELVDFRARVIATTNANLKELVKERKFRADLYYRLNVFRISLPPLRRRQVDILPLLNHFLDEFNRTHHGNLTFTTEAVQVIREFSWPGNIRELRSFVEKSVVFIGGAEMNAGDVIQMLPNEQIENKVPASRTYPLAPEAGTLKERLGSCEKEIIKEAIGTARTLREAADQLKIDLSTLMRKKKKYGLTD